MTSGFERAPGYSPTNPIVGPLTIPPSANFAKLPLIKAVAPAINAGKTNAAAGPKLFEVSFSETLP